MKRLLAFLLTLWMLPMGLLGQTPLKPVDGIYDPEGWLEESARLEMEGNISAAREKGGVAIFVAVLSAGFEDDADQAALAMGRSWGGDRLWGLILHVVDEPESPRYFSEFNRVTEWSKQQKADFQASIQRSLSEASRKAKLSAGPQSQVASGTRILSEELGYLGLVIEKIDHNNAQARGDRGAEGDSEKESKEGSPMSASSVLLLVIGGLIVISIFVFFRLKNEEVREMEYYFPETSPRKRFLGPWSGGGNVLVQFNATNQGVGRESDRRF